MKTIPDEGRLAQLMEQVRTVNPAGNWMKQAAEMIVEQMLAAEVDERLGRAPYQRRRDEQQAGHRNGYKSRSLKSAEGRLEIDLPQVRGLDEPYRSAIWEALGRKTPALEKLACEMYARGLSTRDIEELLGQLGEEEADENGERSTLLSRSAVSRVTEARRCGRSTRRLPSGTWAASTWSTCSATRCTRACGSRPAAARRSW